MNMFVAKCYRNFLPTSFIIYISKLGDEFWNLFILSFLLSKDVHVHEFSQKKRRKEDVHVQFNDICNRHG